jgi:hypothetical protein
MAETEDTLDEMRARVVELDEIIARASWLRRWGTSYSALVAERDKVLDDLAVARAEQIDSIRKTIGELDE